jgi:hypothetical protein
MMQVLSTLEEEEMKGKKRVIPYLSLEKRL